MAVVRTTGAQTTVVLKQSTQTQLYHIGKLTVGNATIEQSDIRLHENGDTDFNRNTDFKNL